MGNKSTSNQNKEQNVPDLDGKTLEGVQQLVKPTTPEKKKLQGLHPYLNCLNCPGQINQNKSKKLIGELKEISPGIIPEDFQNNLYKTSEPFCSKNCRTNYEYGTLLQAQQAQQQQALQAQQRRAQQAVQAQQALQSVEVEGYINSSDEEKEDTNSMKGKPKIRVLQKRVFEQNKKKKQILEKKIGGKKKRKRKTKKKKNKKRGYRGKSPKKKKTKKHRGKSPKKKKTKKHRRKRTRKRR